jgi:predicted ribosomally synthesized peptide with nif11-like leader
MSIESAKAFVERMKTDEDFAKNVTECPDNEARKTFVKAAGFDFTMDEVKEVASELTEEELDGVAGGANYDEACKLFWGMSTPK